MRDLEQPIQLRIPTFDGWDLAADFHPPRSAGGMTKLAIVLPAIGASRRRYAPFARHLAAAGWTVVAFDYRGIGGSRPGRADAPAPTLTDWGERDLDAVIAWAEQALGPERMVAVAHSIGGQLVGLAPSTDRLAAVLAVSTPRPFWWLWSGPYRHLVRGFFRLGVPALVALFGRLPMRLARLHDLPAEVARDWARTSLAEAPDEDARYRRQRERFTAFRTPTLALSFADDRFIAPEPTVTALLTSFYRNAPYRRCHVVPSRAGLSAIGHSGFFDGQVPRTWWDEARTWLDGRAPRRSSSPTSLFAHLVD